MLKEFNIFEIERWTSRSSDEQFQ